MIDLLEYPKTVTVTLLSLAFLSRHLWPKEHKSRYPLPPGPKGYPLVGNLFDISQPDPWKHYSKLSKQFGDMIYIESLGTKILVLLSYRRITEVLEGRSSNYSDRPTWPMLNEVMDYSSYFSNQNYNSMWRRQRRVFHEHFKPASLHRYHPTMYEESRRLAQDILASPDKFALHVQLYVNRIIVKSIYGLDIKDDNDPYLNIVKEAVTGFTTAAVPGRFLVDIMPALKFVPSWMPGAGWKRWAEYYTTQSFRARTEPFNMVREALAKGSAEPCMVSRMIEEFPPVEDPKYREEEAVALGASGVGYIAGSDTTLGAANTFILLMAMYPEVQRRAQEELDTLLGIGNLPTIEDRPRLVYITALLREVFRWQTEFPLGVPHASAEDDIYDGYFIPKGTLILANSWQATHILKDPTLYDNPEEFRPERHIKDGRIDPDIFDPYSTAFGSGRRICPGRHASLDSLFILTTTLLSLFDILPPTDDKGNSVLQWTFGAGLLHQPDRFDCVVQPRTPRHEQIVRAL